MRQQLDVGPGTTLEKAIWWRSGVRLEAGNGSELEPQDEPRGSLGLG